MKKNISIFVASFIFLHLSIGCFNVLILNTIGQIKSLNAQPYPYRKYENRKEGLVPKKTLVAGEKLVLISSLLENQEIIPPTTASYKLGFYLADSARMNLDVREFNHNYKMEPLQDKYKAGIQTFTWPSEIPRYYNIKLADLFPLAKIRGAGVLTIVPVVLYYENPTATEVTYRFSFIPSNTIRELEYFIYRPGHDSPIFIGRLSDLVSEKIFHIQWKSKDNQNRSVPSGLLILNMKATFKPTPGSEMRREVALTYQFYHVADFFKHQGFSKR